jgi:hypothetical protein
MDASVHPPLRDVAWLARLAGVDEIKPSELGVTESDLDLFGEMVGLAPRGRVTSSPIRIPGHPRPDIDPRVLPALAEWVESNPVRPEVSPPRIPTFFRPVVQRREWDMQHRWMFDSWARVVPDLANLVCEDCRLLKQVMADRLEEFLSPLDSEVSSQLP